MRKWLLLVFLCNSPWSLAKGDFGAGIILGDPTGVTGKMYLRKDRALDLAIGWSMGHHGHQSFNIHGDYLWVFPDAITIKSEKFSTYFGAGFRWIKWKDNHYDHDHYFFHPRHDHDHHHAHTLGARIPGGGSYMFRAFPLELFVELAFTLDLIPDADIDLDLGTGARFFF